VVSLLFLCVLPASEDIEPVESVLVVVVFLWCFL